MRSTPSRTHLGKLRSTQLWRRKLTSSNGLEMISILTKNLNSVAAMSHQNVVCGINKKMIWIQLTNTNQENRIALRIKDLNSAAAVLANNNISIRKKTKTGWISQLTIPISN